MGRWIAAVPSIIPGSRNAHAVVMEHDRRLADPNELHAYTSVTAADVIQARALLPVESPIWQQQGTYWRIGGQAAAR